MFNSAKKAFTLIELLVVIAIIALLLSIVMPTLTKAKQLAAAAVCLSNDNQLGKAYYIFTDENNGKLADGVPAWSKDGWLNGSHSFVAAPMDDSAGFNFRNDSLEDKIRGFEAGALWPYLETHKIFNCPVDKRYRKPPEYQVSGRPAAIGGYRSYSIGAVLSHRGYKETGTAEDKVTITKYSDFSNPSSKIVFIEEADGSGYNHNTWNMFLNEERWYDPVAIWHNGSSTFAYADGHADRFRWTDKVMIDMASSDPVGGNKNRLADNNSDDYEMVRRMYMPRRYNP